MHWIKQSVIPVYEPEKPTVTGYNIDLGHRILTKKSRLRDRNVREAMDIELHPNGGGGGGGAGYFALGGNEINNP
jgi:hypothetical protein